VRRGSRAAILLTAAVLVGVVLTIVLSYGLGQRTPSRPTEGRGTSAAPVSRAALGVQSHSMREADRFGAWVGRPVKYVVLYNDSSTWTNLEHPWFLGAEDPDQDWAKWAIKDGARRLVISQSMVPDNPAPDWRQRGAAGEYDRHWQVFAASLVDAGIREVVVRLGWEMNTGSFPGHYIGPTELDTAAWKNYFRRIVEVTRSATGSRILFDWNPNARSGDVPFSDYYPGNDVVDIVGLDVYDTSYGQDLVDPRRRWQELLHARGGLAEFIAFSKDHGKPMSFPEWALVAPGNPAGSNGAGDNPYFVDAMATTVSTNNVAYEAYYNVPGGGVEMTLYDAPQSREVFRRRFGPQGDA
jgi:hypothetical protein